MIRGLVSVTRSASERRAAGAAAPARPARRPAQRRPAGAEHQNHERGPDQAPHQEVQRPERRREQVEHHGGGHADLSHGDGQHERRPAPEAAAGRIGSPASPGPPGRPRSPRKTNASTRWVQCSAASGAAGGSTPSVAERKAEAEEPGVEVGDLGAEQDHHEAERRRWPAPARAHRCALRGAAAAARRPARLAGPERHHHAARPAAPSRWPDG